MTQPLWCLRSLNFTWRTGIVRMFQNKFHSFTAPPTAAAVNLSRPAFESRTVTLNIMWTMPTYEYVVTSFNITLYSSTRERTDLSLTSLIHSTCCSYTVTGLIIGETYTATVKAISHDVASPESVESDETKACKLYSIRIMRKCNTLKPWSCAAKLSVKSNMFCRRWPVFSPTMWKQWNLPKLFDWFYLSLSIWIHRKELFHRCVRFNNWFL